MSGYDHIFESPVEITYSGDIGMASRYKGQAMSCLRRAKDESLSSDGIDLFRQYHLGSGVIVSCTVGKFYDTANVYHPPRGGKGVERYRECFCVHHFAVGQIVAVTPSEPTASFLETGRFKYDINVCAKDMYLFYEDAIDENFGRYWVNQVVLVTIGEISNDFNPDCNRGCLNNLPRFDLLAVCPIEIEPDKMLKWQEITR